MYICCCLYSKGLINLHAFDNINDAKIFYRNRALEDIQCKIFNLDIEKNVIPRARVNMKWAINHHKDIIEAVFSDIISDDKFNNSINGLKYFEGFGYYHISNSLLIIYTYYEDNLFIDCNQETLLSYLHKQGDILLEQYKTKYKPILLLNGQI